MISLCTRKGVEDSGKAKGVKPIGTKIKRSSKLLQMFHWFNTMTVLELRWRVQIKISPEDGGDGLQQTKPVNCMVLVSMENAGHWSPLHNARFTPVEPYCPEPSHTSQTELDLALDTNKCRTLFLHCKSYVIWFVHCTTYLTLTSEKLNQSPCNLLVFELYMGMGNSDKSISIHK